MFNYGIHLSAVILCHVLLTLPLSGGFDESFYQIDGSPKDRIPRSTLSSSPCPPQGNSFSFPSWATFSRIASPLRFCKNATNCKDNQNICCPFGIYSQKVCMRPTVLPNMGTTTTPPIVKHKPFFGLPRYCPTTEPIQEILPVRNCTQDRECEPPRICCPDGGTSYCRTPSPQLDARNSYTLRVVKNLVSYMQCTPPPPPILDLFPKTCKYYIDCFPNLCCQEKDHKVCRPPKRSILRLLLTPIN